jgi:hypothetical protein
VNEKIEHGHDSVEFLLKHLGEPVILGGTPYANLPYIVGQIAAEPRLGDTQEVRGLFLADLVETLIAQGVGGGGEPRTQRELRWAVLQRRYVDDKAIKEIAKELAISPRAVQRHRHAGVLLLEKKLLEYLRGGSDAPVRG